MKNHGRRMMGKLPTTSCTQFLGRRLRSFWQRPLSLCFFPVWQLPWPQVFHTPFGRKRGSCRLRYFWLFSWLISGFTGLTALDTSWVSFGAFMPYITAQRAYVLSTRGAFISSTVSKALSLDYRCW